MRSTGVYPRLNSESNAAVCNYDTPPPDFVTQKTCILQLFDKQYFVSLRRLILRDAMTKSGKSKIMSLVAPHVGAYVSLNTILTLF